MGPNVYNCTCAACIFILFLRDLTHHDFLRILPVARQERKSNFDLLCTSEIYSFP